MYTSIQYAYKVCRYIILPYTLPNSVWERDKENYYQDLIKRWKKKHLCSSSTEKIKVYLLNGYKIITVEVQDDIKIIAERYQSWEYVL